MKHILAIQGKRASGKDTTALFFNYLLNTPSWSHHYWLFKLCKFKFKTWNIHRYAENLKHSLACILNIDVDKFEDREFKEYFYFNFNTYTLFDSRIRTPKSIKDKEFSRQLSKGNLNLALEYELSIRQILMFYGTDIMRRFFGDKLWIYSIIKNNDQKIVIADQRFNIENKLSKVLANTIIIHIIRNNQGDSLHSSEKELDNLFENKSYDYLIDNNYSLKNLFNQCKQIAKIIKKYDRN